MKNKDNLSKPSDVAEGSKVVPGCGDSAEVTPEMIEAGLPFLFDYDPQYSNERDIVAAIFEAMIAVQNH